MARISRQAPIEKNLDLTMQNQIATLIRLLDESGLKIRKHEVRRLHDSNESNGVRQTLLLRIAPRLRANVHGSTTLSSRVDVRPRWQLATYLEHLPVMIRALDMFVQGRGVFGLCAAIRTHGVSAIERRNSDGTFTLWFPGADPDYVAKHKGPPVETLEIWSSGAHKSFKFSGIVVPDLHLGHRRDDIAEAIFVLLSHDDWFKGVEAVRRLR